MAALPNSETTEAELNDQLRYRYMRERVAFALFSEAQDPTPPADHEAAWRALSPADIEAWRSRADKVTNQLLCDGVKISVCKWARLKEAVDEILTVPARKVYSLD